MADTQLNAPSPRPSSVPETPHGVIRVTGPRPADETDPHRNANSNPDPDPDHTHLGHHLTRHRALSCTAIGLAAYILSVPDGTPVDIRSLASRFPEGRDRIAGALRELERHGYIERVRKHLPNGTWVTLTYAYEDPATSRTQPDHEAPPPAPRHATPRSTTPQSTAPRSTGPPPPKKPQPPLPSPTAHAPELHSRAADLLASLRTADPRLTLAERDVRRLAPAVAAWLERGTHPDAVRAALTTGLPPDRLHSPAAFLAYRLTTLLPPPLPTLRQGPPPPPPLQTCDSCDRAFRSRTPGHCGDCRASATRKDVVYGEDVTIADRTISTENLPLYAT
ncbi:helix-turn-helix domain-containing protein [Streptomyces uncialis]|uniref:hypothetical protein n=1 Tax=Streptomyces uncialis TaxID=1048205 RepID=UPI002E3364FF|nr:hypothetical protein [Streptomyces uncialis]